MIGALESLKRLGSRLLAAAILFAPASAWADRPSLLGVRLGGDLHATRLVLDLSAKLAPEIELERDRLVVEIEAAPSAETAGSGKGLIVGWSSQAAGADERLQLSLSGPVRIAHRFLIPPGQGTSYWRYVVDLEPGEGETSAGRAGSERQASVAGPADAPALGRGFEAPPTAHASEADADSSIDQWVQGLSAENRIRESVPRERADRPLRSSEEARETRRATRLRKASLKATAALSRARKVVVIDAGHGGHDSGALGATHQEKELTLAAALALKQRLEKSGRYKVILTRDSDVFIPLADRVKIARRGGVDLFLSLHADSAGVDTATHGASVYTLSDTGVGRAHYVLGHDEWFTKVAARSGQPGVSQILLDLSQRSTRNHSAEFADLLLQKLQGRGVDILPRGHRDAGYFVLLAPDVPAALLEMGFVTNPEDEARLSEPKTRGRMVDAVADAIDAYFDTSRPSDAPKA